MEMSYNWMEWQQNSANTNWASNGQFQGTPEWVTCYDTVVALRGRKRQGGPRLPRSRITNWAQWSSPLVRGWDEKRCRHFRVKRTRRLGWWDSLTCNRQSFETEPAFNPWDPHDRWRRSNAESCRSLTFQSTLWHGPHQQHTLIYKLINKCNKF